MALVRHRQLPSTFHSHSAQLPSTFHSHSAQLPPTFHRFFRISSAFCAISISACTQHRGCSTMHVCVCVCVCLCSVRGSGRRIGSKAGGRQACDLPRRSSHLGHAPHAPCICNKELNQTKPNQTKPNAAHLLGTQLARLHLALQVLRRHLQPDDAAAGRARRRRYVQGLRSGCRWAHTQINVRRCRRPYKGNR